MVKCSIKRCNKKAVVFVALHRLQFCEKHAKEIGLDKEQAVYVFPKDTDMKVEQ